MVELDLTQPGVAEPLDMIAKATFHRPPRLGLLPIDGVGAAGAPPYQRLGYLKALAAPAGGTAEVCGGVMRKPIAIRLKLGTEPLRKRSPSSKARHPVLQTVLRAVRIDALPRYPGSDRQSVLRRSESCEEVTRRK